MATASRQHTLGRPGIWRLRTRSVERSQPVIELPHLAVDLLPRVPVRNPGRRLEGGARSRTCLVLSKRSRPVALCCSSHRRSRNARRRPSLSSMSTTTDVPCCAKSDACASTKISPSDSELRTRVAAGMPLIRDTADSNARDAKSSFRTSTRPESLSFSQVACAPVRAKRGSRHFPRISRSTLSAVFNLTLLVEASCTRTFCWPTARKFRHGPASSRMLTGRLPNSCQGTAARSDPIHRHRRSMRPHRRRAQVGQAQIRGLPGTGHTSERARPR